MEKLKPCPFCGEANAVICETDYCGNPAYAVSCRTKECAAVIFSLGFGQFETKDQAVAAWNTRA